MPCGEMRGDDRRLQAGEVFKLAVKRLVLTSSSPGSNVFPSASVLIEPKHLRQDRSGPRDVYAVGNGMHRKDNVMNVVITFALKYSCLIQYTKGSDYVIRAAELVKLKANARSIGPIQSSSAPLIAAWSPWL
jgi:hypothetical protein